MKYYEGMVRLDICLPLGSKMTGVVKEWLRLFLCIFKLIFSLLRNIDGFFAIESS